MAAAHIIIQYTSGVDRQAKVARSFIDPISIQTRQFVDNFQSKAYRWSWFSIPSISGKIATDLMTLLRKNDS